MTCKVSNHKLNEENGNIKIPDEDTFVPSKLPRRLTEVCSDLALTQDTTCGIGCIKGPLLQRFANKKAYVILYGIVGCIYSAGYSYFSGTITTLEKRFKIPSRTTGIITVGNDISQLFISVILSYYAGRGHRPRWIALGLYTVVTFCLMNALPHFLYGPGQDALSLTFEYGGHSIGNKSVAQVLLNKQVLCQLNSSVTCDPTEGSVAPQIILFAAQLISGFGGSLYHSLGLSYMDDNVKRSKTPALISFSYFIRMLGPAAGYALAGFCLKLYISPTLTPTINKEDPRWLGAWWLGWLILAGLLFVFTSLLVLFPKTLPRAAARKVLSLEKTKLGDKIGPLTAEAEIPASFGDMMKTFKRLAMNRTLMCNNLAAVFYFLGYMPYWIFMAKYIETMFKQSASYSSWVTGYIGLVFSAIGILVSGLVISRYKPKARYLAGWNVIVGAVSVLGIIAYAFLGCPENEHEKSMIFSGELQTVTPCNEMCNCQYTKYSPVCAPNGQTFISPCHAGCKEHDYLDTGSKIYTNCSCIKETDSWMKNSTKQESLPYVLPGACAVDCTTSIYIFLGIVCIMKFFGATGRASNFLVTVRCVEEKDKTVAMGFGLMLMSMFAFIPSPILFGYIIDETCLVWGRTCSGRGNCWLYNASSLRFLLNFTAVGFVAVGTFFDAGVWYFVNDLKIFDEEEEGEMKKVKKDSDKRGTISSIS